MKIGYPCINRSLNCKGNRTFRLKSYSESKLVKTVENNLNCLFAILKFNVKNGIFFFKITSDLVPFASHPVCTFGWQKHFRAKFRDIGKFITGNGIRVSMHPDQFTLINSLSRGIFLRSRQELLYHAEVLDLMGLDATARIQIHVGGVYGDKDASIKRFISRYSELDSCVKKRLVVENDDRCYNIRDCLEIYKAAGVPVLFDVLHDSINPCSLSIREILHEVKKTWESTDGVPMVDYSSQKKGGKPGQHAEHINLSDFKKFITASKNHNIDIMLEIKDKEKSALRAIESVSRDRRLGNPLK
jgi:UV DNA damage endonuclease